MPPAVCPATRARDGSGSRRSGPVIAGVIGKSKYIYDLWGDTVNLASRMETAGLPDSIQVTRAVYDQLKDRFAFEPRGALEIKGKGEVEAWLLRV